MIGSKLELQAFRGFDGCCPLAWEVLTSCLVEPGMDCRIGRKVGDHSAAWVRIEEEAYAQTLAVGACADHGRDCLLASSLECTFYQVVACWYSAAP